MSKLYRFILSLTFESPSYSFSIHPNIIHTSYFVKKKGEDSFLSYMIVNLLLQVVPLFFFYLLPFWKHIESIKLMNRQANDINSHQLLP